jgi:hypothetical protein
MSGSGMISPRRAVKMPATEARDAERDAIVDHLRLELGRLRADGHLTSELDHRRLDALLDGVTGGLHR